MRLNICIHFSLVLDYGTDYRSVYDETASVTEWFTLGLYLNLPPAELEIINADYRFQTKQARRELLSLWLKTGNATWSNLIHALSKMGLRGLGKDIVIRKGWGMITVHIVTKVSVYNITNVMTTALPIFTTRHSNGWHTNWHWRSRSTSKNGLFSDDCCLIIFQIHTVSCWYCFSFRYLHVFKVYTWEMALYTKAKARSISK